MLYFLSLYYKKDVFTGANKRFDELGRLYSKMLGAEFRVIVCEGEQPIWATHESCIFVPPYTNKVQRILSMIKLHSILAKIESGHVISDFMPIPFRALKFHRHFQLIYDLRNFTDFRRGGLSFLTGRFQKWQLSRSKTIITISESSREDIYARCSIPKSRIVVSYCGTGSHYVPPSAEAEKDIDLLYVATFEPRKNHIGLMKALALSTKGLSVRFIGRDLGTQADVRKLAQQLEKERGFKIEFIESIDETELIRSYQRAKVYVFPSFLEGFGMPLIEALNTGCRIACSNIDVFRELCEDQAEYFDPENIQEMWSTIRRTLAERRSPSTQEFVKRYHWKKIAMDLLDDIHYKSESEVTHV